MAKPPVLLVYCADGNPRFAQIAIDHGFLYGSQMPRKCYFPPYFIDLNPNRLPAQPVYVARLRKWRPAMASVHDWFEERRFEEIIMRAEEISQYTDNVLLIPKVPGGIKRLPGYINGKRVILGYSVPTSHGATAVDLNEFAGWPIHILGGSPQKQMALYRELSQFAEVVSVDGNYAQRMSIHNKFWCSGKWLKLDENGAHFDRDAPYESFRRSCQNIMEAWGKL